MTGLIRFIKAARRSEAAVAAAVILAFLPKPAAGQDNQNVQGWKDQAELSYVLTGGNAASSTFSLSNTFKRSWEKDSVTVKTFLLRSNATTETRTAVGTETDYQVVEQKIERLVAENYILGGEYARRISKSFLAQAGLIWDRNRFAGVEGRTMLTAGAGLDIVDAKKTQIKSEAGVTYTLRKYVGQRTTSFAGFRALLSAAYQPLEKSAIATIFVFDDNLKNSVDWRFDWTNSVTASIVKSIALKTSLRLLYAHLPARQSVALFGPAGEETGLFVPVSLKPLDSFFTTSIVINF